MEQDRLGEDPLVEVLVPAARALNGCGWVFTGFNLPVLAARVARRLAPDAFVQVLEGGAALPVDTPELMTTTTDYFSYARLACWRGSTADVLLHLVPRCDLVVLDGANVDLAGRTNSHAVGPLRAPHVRMPGGGGGPEASAGARDLLLLHGGGDVRRLVRRVEHVSTSPTRAERIRLVTRWGVLLLGERPRLESVVPGPDLERALAHLELQGLVCEDVPDREAPTADERAAVAAVLREAAAKGYEIAARAVRAADQDHPTSALSTKGT